MSLACSGPTRSKPGHMLHDTNLPWQSQSKKGLRVCMRVYACGCAAVRVSERACVPVRACARAWVRVCVCVWVVG